MKKLPVVLLLFLFAIGCSNKEPRQTKDTDEAEILQEEILSTEESRPETQVKGKGKPYCNHVGKYDEVFNDSNYIQYKSAESLGIDPIYTLSDAYNTSRPLIKVESGSNYTIDNLTHSMPFLVPEAVELLDEISENFGQMVEERGGDRANNKLIVTSLLRTPYTVRKLRRVNRNAVDSSTHMFGTTFDIAWNNFDFPDSSKAVNAGVLKGILAEVLLQKRNEGKCYIKYEKKSPCFHITVRAR